jgi:hypothetical protein
MNNMSCLQMGSHYLEGIRKTAGVWWQLFEERGGISGAAEAYLKGGEGDSSLARHGNNAFLYGLRFAFYFTHIDYWMHMNMDSGQMGLS